MNAMTSLNDTTEKATKDLRAKAIHYDRINEVYNAIEFYSRYLTFEPKDIKLTYRLADLYFETRNYVKANQYYDNVISIDQRKYPAAWYKKGVVCMNLEKYENATESFAKFRKFNKDKKDRLNYRKLAVIYAASCDWAKKNMGKAANIVITHQGEVLNHPDIDFSPYPVDDKTIFYGAVYSDPARQIDPIRQIYKAEMVEGKWKNTGLLEGGINNPEFNTGNLVISEDGHRLFFTRSRKNWQGEAISEIFVSFLADSQWQTPEKLPYPVNSENYTSTQPALGVNLRTGSEILYFVSNRPGGRGGLDLWYAEYDKKTNTFKNPLNLSNKINTIGDECSPFYNISTRTLYFSSNGRKDLFGGFDIFKATGSARKWTEVVPMPRPINSSFDDYYFSILKNGRDGFFSSNRPGAMSLANGTCCDDIFSYKFLDCVKIFSHGTVRNSMDHDFYDNLKKKYNLDLLYPENNSVLIDVPVELYLKGDTENEEILISKTTTGKNGKYYFELDPDLNYKVLVRNYGYLEKKVPISTTGINCSDTIDIGTTLIDYLPRITIQLNIYYDFDKYDLTAQAKQTIDKMVMPLFDIFPTGIIEIGSHTDNVGSDEYNIDLSQKRSESVVSYLISKRISSERLVAKGYGMRIPVAPNTNSDGSDNPEGRQLNRRTEFKVVGEITSSGNDE
jgi:outer membrane protein OmpA-like peptidoglycan-associated protein